MKELHDKTVELGEAIMTLEAELLDLRDSLIKYRDFLNDELRRLK